MATNYANTKLSAYTTIDTAPNRYQTLTGTVVSSGVFVVGTGTLFLTEIGGDQGVGFPSTSSYIDSWLFNGTNEVRRIVGVVDNTHLVLEAAFTVNLAGGAGSVKWIPASRTMQMSWICIAGGGIVDGVTLGANEGGGSGYTASTPNRTVDEIVIDGRAGTVDVTIFTAD